LRIRLQGSPRYRQGSDENARRVNGSANTIGINKIIYFGNADPERTIKLDSVRVIRSAESE
jgi:hypothetical protein